MGSNTGEDFKVFCFSIYMLIAPLGGDSSPLTRLQFRGSVAESWNKKRGGKKKPQNKRLPSYASWMGSLGIPPFISIIFD